MYQMEPTSFELDQIHLAQIKEDQREKIASEIMLAVL